jgi:uncharacterized membrane protein YuzA (DUF378 family)
MKLPSIDTAALFLLIIGGLNAGVNAVFDYNAIGEVLGNSTASTVAYALMGISALYIMAQQMGWMSGSHNRA